MKTNEFYSALTTLPVSYNFVLSGNDITGQITRGTLRGQVINPITAVATKQTGDIFGTNKRETLRAGKALGLSKDSINHIYNATTSVSNRGNAQVVRGKIRSALEI